MGCCNWVMLVNHTYMYMYIYMTQIPVINLILHFKKKIFFTAIIIDNMLTLDHHVLP